MKNVEGGGTKLPQTQDRPNLGRSFYNTIPKGPGASEPGVECLFLRIQIFR